MQINDLAKSIPTTPPRALYNQLTWTDFQTVLVVARHGSVATASAALGMTHSTLLRKLDAMESRLNTKLFERQRGQYTLTTAGQEIERAASVFEPLANAAEARIRGQDLRPSGDVRVTAVSFVIEYLLPGVLAQFASAFPDVRIELAASREMVSLSRREADVAVRIADSVPEWLVGRKLADVEFKIFALRQGESTATPQSIDQLTTEQRWISFEKGARDLKFDRWLDQNIPESSVALRVDSFSNALKLLQAGLGVALLPAFLQHQVPELLALSGPIAELTTPMWLVTHPEIKNTMRIQVLMRAFGPALASAVNAPAINRQL